MIAQSDAAPVDSDDVGFAGLFHLILGLTKLSNVKKGHTKNKI